MSSHERPNWALIKAGNKKSLSECRGLHNMFSRPLQHSLIKSHLFIAASKQIITLLFTGNSFYGLKILAARQPAKNCHLEEKKSSLMVGEKKKKIVYFLFFLLYDLVTSGQIQASCSLSLCDSHFRGFHHNERR